MVKIIFRMQTEFKWRMRNTEALLYGGKQSFAVVLAVNLTVGESIARSTSAAATSSHSGLRNQRCAGIVPFDAMSDSQHNPLDQLSPSERAARYRELAREQRELAEACDIGEIRETHEELAAMWTRLASQAQRQGTSAPASDAVVSRASTTK